MKYCEILRDIAAKPGDRLYYDEQFRLIRQLAPAQCPWDVIRWEFWLNAVTKIFVRKLNFPRTGDQCAPAPASAPSPFQEAHVGVSMREGVQRVPFRTYLL